MKNPLLIKLIIGLIISLSVLDMALAENSASIAVSCTIPAIPGVNVPLIQEKTAKPDVNARDSKNPDEETNTKAPAMFQKDTQEIRLVEGKNSIVALKTLYSR